MALTTGAVLAITLGSSAASAFLPMLLRKRVRQPDQHKNQFPDIQISTADSGQFIAWARGVVKLPCNVIWSNGIQHYTRQTSGGSGGKGGTSPGAGGTVIEHFYQTSVALLCTDCSDGHPIERFLKVWADNDALFYEGVTPTEQIFEAEDATLSGGANVIIDAGANNGEYVTGVGNGGKIIFDFLGLDTPETDDGDEMAFPESIVTFFYKCNGNKTVKLSFNGKPPITKTFIDTAGEWASYDVVYRGTDADDYAISLEISNPAGACPDFDYVTLFHDRTSSNVTRYPKASGAINPNIKYPADLDDPRSFYNQKVVYDSDGSAVVNSAIPNLQIRFYTGTATQMPDPAIVAWLEQRFEDGEDYASAYRKFSYVVLENLTLKNGRMPNFTVELDAGRNTVSELVEDIYDLVNVESSDLELDALEDLPITTVDGMLVYQFTPAAELIKKLETWFNFRMVEVDGKIKAVTETGSAAVTIPPTDLKAHDFGEEMPAFEAEHPLGDEKSLPNEIIVSAMDANQDYHANPQSEQLFASTATSEPIEMSFPFVATPDEMKRVSNTQVMKTHLESKPYSFSTMPEWGKLTPGDKVNLELSTRTVEVKITKKTMALPGRCQFEAVLHSNYIYNQSNVRGTRRRAHSLRSELESLPQYPRNSKLVVIESIPILREQRGELGVYMAVCGRGVGRWNGATIYRDTGDGMFEPISVVEAPSPIGVCQDTLGDWSPVADVDTTNEVLIYFYDEVSLENVDESEARNNPALNLIRIGGEWTQFLTATVATVPVDEPYRSAWTVSDFLRGRFDTEIAGHGAGEIAVVATSALKWRRFETVEIGTTINLKAVTNNQAVENAETVSFTLDGLSIKPTPKTAGYDVTLYDDLRTFTNDGATELVQFLLPAIVSVEGFEISFVVIANEYIHITAFAGEEIFIGADFGGEIYSDVEGSYITLKAVSGVWVAEYQPSGTWTFGTPAEEAENIAFGVDNIQYLGEDIIYTG